MSPRRSRDQDVRGLIEVAGAEALPVLLVEPQACSLVRLRRDDLALDQDPHRRLFCGLGASFRIAQRLGLDAEPHRFLQQQFAHDQRPRRRLPRQDRLFRWMVLHLAGDHFARQSPLPLTLMVFGLGSAFVTEQSMTYSAG